LGVKKEKRREKGGEIERKGKKELPGCHTPAPKSHFPPKLIFRAKNRSLV
jgi:hypothetical protein